MTSMTSQSTQPTQPLADIDVNMTDAKEGEEDMWRRLCTEAGVPQSYLEPAAAREASHVAKKAKEAKAKRIKSMRAAIKRATLAAAATATATATATASATAIAIVPAMDSSPPPCSSREDEMDLTTTAIGSHAISSPGAAGGSLAGGLSVGLGVAEGQSHVSLSVAPSGASQRLPPSPVLPQGWVQRLDADSGEPYYFKLCRVGRAQWERPTQPVVDMGDWCSVDLAEVAAARAELQAGDFSHYWPSLAPELPKLPRRPEPVVDLDAHDRRQAEYQRIYAEVQSARAEHATRMVAREKQLHQLRQSCLERTRRWGLDRLQRELQAVFPSRSSPYSEELENVANLHLKHCCPPIESPLWERCSGSEHFFWCSLPECYEHHRTLAGPNHPCTADCDRRRKLLGVERLAPHAEAESDRRDASRSGRLRWPNRYVNGVLPTSPPTWRDWTVLHIHARVRGATPPPLTCSQDRCGCRAVTHASPLQLTCAMALAASRSAGCFPAPLGGTLDSPEDVCGRLLKMQARLKAQGVPVDDGHLEQLLTRVRELDAPALSVGSSAWRASSREDRVALLPDDLRVLADLGDLYVAPLIGV